MDPITFEFKSPLKGVEKNPSFYDSNPEFTIDAQNVLPQDKNGRYRVNQRTGFSKVYASPLVAGNQVAQLAQVGLALDPNNAVPSQTVFLEDFSTYADGTAIDGTTNWKTYSDFDNTSEVQWSLVEASTTSVKTSVSHNSASGFNVLQNPPATGKSYIVKMDFKAADPLVGNCEYNVYARCSTNTRTSIRLQLFANSTNQSISITSPDSGITGASTTLPGTTVVAGTTYTLELRVSGDSFSGYLNGVLKVGPYTTTHSNTQTGFGWSFAGATSMAAARGDNFKVLSGIAANYRKNYILALCQGNVFLGDLSTIATVTNGTGVYNPGVIPQIANSQGFAYIVDGSSILKVDIANATMVTYTATAGTAPTGCTLAAVYRDRLVLAAPVTSPQNFYCSRVGTHTDWDYSQLATGDTASAFAGNASTAGHIGEPIIALMPASDDVMFIGGDHNLWAMRGDPADGGSIDLISDAIGILGANAWTKAPDGTIYFLGTGGLYKMAPGGSTPVNISSEKWNEFFRTIDRTQNYTSLEWDRNQHTLYVFITPVQPTFPTHLAYDEKTQSFWPLKIPVDMGPISALVFDGNVSGDRTILLGGRSGYVQKFDQTAKTDDGTAIESWVYIGPFKAADSLESTLQWSDVIFGEPAGSFVDGDFSANVAFLAGQALEEAYTQPLRTSSKIFNGSRRQKRWIQRLRGNVFFLRISNAVINKTWSLERVVSMFMPGGLVRRK